MDHRLLCEPARPVARAFAYALATAMVCAWVGSGAFAQNPKDQPKAKAPPATKAPQKKDAPQAPAAPAEQAQQGGLATTVETHDPDPLPLLNAEGDAIQQRLDSEALVDRFEVDPARVWLLGFRSNR